MSSPDQEVLQERRKRTVWLLAGGAASLLLPLAGAFYMRWSETKAVSAPSGRSDVFERRDGGASKITPSQTVVPMSAIAAAPAPAPSSLGMPAPGGRAEKSAESSLDFIKPADELKAQVSDAPKPAAAPAAAPAPAPAAEAPKTKAKSKAPAKPAKKAFAMPKLQPTRGFSSMKGPAGPAAAPDQTSGGQSPQDLLKNLPPGAENNPELQKYLQNQGK